MLYPAKQPITFKSLSIALLFQGGLHFINLVISSYFILALVFILRVASKYCASEGLINYLYFIKEEKQVNNQNEYS